jgi:CBS domain-containing protein
MQALDVMTRRVVSVPATTPVAEVARLLLRHRISAVPVVDAGGGLVGIVSEGDLIGRIGGEGGRRSWWLGLLAGGGAPAEDRSRGRTAGEVMSHEPITCREDTPLAEIARLLERHRVKRLPVLAEGRLVGIVSRADLVRAVAAQPGAAAPAAADDRALRTRLLDDLERRGMARHPCVNVVVSDGTVHLWGVVADSAEADALRRAAEEVAGEAMVRSHLAVDASRATGPAAEEAGGDGASDRT